MSPFSVRLVAAAAIGWGLLVWGHWFPSNPLRFREVGIALAAFAGLDPGRALAAAAGHAVRLALLGGLIVAVLGAGWPALRFLAGRPPRYAGLHAGALGAAALGFGALGAGFPGLARPGIAWVAVAVAAGCGLRRLGGIRRLGWCLAGDAWPGTLLVALALGIGLLGALAPEISFDALAHHLGHPALAAASGRVTALPHHFLSHYPSLLEAQYLLAWLIGGGPDLPKLVHWAWGVASAFAIVGWARETLPARRALLAGAGFLLLPYVQTVLMWAYVDLGAAACLTLTCLAARAGGGGPWLAGALAGCTAGIKAAGVFAPVLAAVVVLHRPPAIRRDVARVWLPLAAAFVLVCLPWGAKNWCLTGNPFAPFLAGRIPTLWWDAGNQARYLKELRSYELGASPGGGWLAVFGQPWASSVRNFGVLDQQSGMGAWFLWLLPLLPLLRAPAARLPARLALAYFLLWFLIPRQVRYLMPAWPAAAVASVHALHALGRLGGLATIPVRAAAVLLVLALAAAFQREHFVINPVPVVFGTETPDAYLARGLPGKPHSVRIIARLRNHPPAGRVLVVSQYGLNLYWGPRAISQSAFDTPVIERLARGAARPERIGVGLRQWGVTDVLYSAQGGFTMHAVYGMYGFDAASAARWREYWTTRMRLVHNQDDRFLLFRPARAAARPGDPAAAAARSVLPGLDELWLGETDWDLQYAAQQGTEAVAIPAATVAYERIARATDSPAAWERLGGVLLRRRRFAEGLAALRRAERAGRSTGVLHDALGVALFHEGRSGEAIVRFRRALEHEPGLLDARRNLVRLLQARGQRDEAVRELRAGLALDPEAGELRALFAEITGREP